MQQELGIDVQKILSFPTKQEGYACTTRMDMFFKSPKDEDERNKKFQKLKQEGAGKRR